MNRIAIKKKRAFSVNELQVAEKQCISQSRLRHPSAKVCQDNRIQKHL